MTNIFTPAVRQWVYAIATAALAVLVVYKIVDPDQVPLWVSLVAAVLGLGGTSTATVAVAKQRKASGTPAP